MFWKFALFGAVAASNTTRCDKVPTGEYYAWLSPGKYLYLEVAEDSSSFRTSLRDFAETDSEMDSEDEDRWVVGANYLVSKVDFQLRPDCVGKIADHSMEAYWNLLMTVSKLVRVCVHPGGMAEMSYDPRKDALKFGCLGMQRAVNGEVKFSYTSLKPKKDTFFVPRGVFTNYSAGAMHAVRVVDRSTVWIKTVVDGETKRFSAGFEMVDGKICIVMNKVTDLAEMMSIVPYLQEVARSNSLCFGYSPEKRALMMGEMEFKFEGVLPRKPMATRY